MPVVTPVAAVRFDDHPGTNVIGLASPSRGSAELSAWRLRLEPGTASPAHSLDREEVFVILDGRLRLTCDGVVEEAQAGGALIAPVGAEFTISNPGPGPVDAVACAPSAIRATVGDQSFAPPWAV